MNPIQRAQRMEERRRSRQDGIESLAPSPVLLSGEFRFVGSGEGLVEVRFPEPFSEKPITTFGFEYESDSVNEVPAILQEGSYPSVTLGVAVYLVNTTLSPEIRPSRVLYTGMHVMVKTSGGRRQKLIVGWHAHGMAYNVVNQ